jgi:hypothetical protein
MRPPVSAAGFDNHLLGGNPDVVKEDLTLVERPLADLVQRFAP